MACPKSSPCQPYIDVLDLCCLGPSGNLPDPCLTNGTPVDPQIIEDSIQAASEMLWALTGRQFGVCDVTIRPCATKGSCNPCPDGGELPFFGYGGWSYGSYPWYPQHTAAGWINVRPCGCQSSCGCAPLCETALPYPTCSINEVKVNGISLAPALYRIDDFNKLVRLAGDMNVENLQSANPDVTVAGSNQTGVGLELPLNAPTQYNVVLGGNRRGITLDYVWGPGVSGTISTFGIAGGEWDYEVISGNPSNVSRLGQTITVGPPQDAGSNARLRIRMTDPGTITDFFVQHTLTGSLFLSQVAWIDESSGSGQCWPDCQDLSVDDNQPNTYSINLSYGRPVPALVKAAAAKLACEFILSCVGQPCALPQRVTQIQRQGVSMTLIDPQTFLTQGFTGIYIVDQAILTYNPRRLLRQASVYSPDASPKWRRTTG